MALPNAMTIYGSFKNEIQYLPSKLPEVPSRKLDQDKLETWKKATARDKKESLALKKICMSIKNVSYKEFKSAVAICVSNFKKSSPDQYISFVEPGKSQTWVTAIAIDQGLKPTMFMRIGEEGANLLENTLLEIGKEIFPRVKGGDIVRDIVIVDDAAFTGNQMANNISSAIATLTKTFGWSNNPYCFHVIAPYTTAAAEKKIYNIKKKGGANIRLYTLTEKMPVLSDVIHKNSLCNSAKILGVSIDRVNTTALTYFDHKIPNSMSFPNELAQNGFIPTDDPPYKRPPYVKEEE